MPTIVEVGPSAVRVLSGGSGCRPDDAMMSAALDGIDDTVALFDDRPVAVVDMWRVVMASILRGRRDPVVVVHPSWWSWARVQRVVDAAAATGRRVNAQSRSELISRDHPVIEIAGEFVAVCHGPAVWVRCRDDLAAVEEITAELPGNDEVLLDVATGMPGSASTAAAIREILARRGLAARDVCLAERAAAALAPPRWRPAIRAALTVSAVLMVLTGLIVVAWRTPGRAPVPAQPVAAADSTSLVEGRIAVAIPPHWLVQRITAGPGSRRVQVSSPADADLALHITQSYAPETTLAEAAEVLGRAIADQPPGVFVDFRLADDVAGRPAVTYREVRAGRVIRWSVVLDRSTRISIGCQSAPGHEDNVRAVCDQAVRSAHEVGTASRG